MGLHKSFVFIVNGVANNGSGKSIKFEGISNGDLQKKKFN